MRVISGELKGRKIAGYDIDGTRPTMDYIKESMFAMIWSYINNSIVLDLFAGTGSLGIEAISNGAKKCYFVDKNIKAINTITETVKKFNIESKTSIIHDDYRKSLKKFNEKNIKFDIVLLDPPYNMEICKNIITELIELSLISDNGIIVCETEAEIDNIDIDFLKIIKQKRYSTKKITIFCINYCK